VRVVWSTCGSAFWWRGACTSAASRTQCGHGTRVAARQRSSVSSLRALALFKSSCRPPRQRFRAALELAYTVQRLAVPCVRACRSDHGRP
jgi:hypothetical protein